MSQYCSSSELKNTAKEHLAGRYASVVLLTVVSIFMVIPVAYFQTFVESGISLLFGGNTTLLLSILLFLVSQVIISLSSLINIGAYLFYLKMACCHPHALSDLFYCFSEGRLGKSVMVAVCMRLPSIICSLPYIICAYIYPFPATNSYLLLALIVGIVVPIPLELALSMSYFLILDFPEYSVKDILSHSIQLMKGNKGRLFYIEISFLPLHILGIFSMGIGYLWLTPYINMTRTLFFLDLMKPNPENASVI